MLVETGRRGLISAMSYFGARPFGTELYSLRSPNPRCGFGLTVTIPSRDGLRRTAAIADRPRDVVAPAGAPLCAPRWTRRR